MEPELRYCIYSKKRNQYYHNYNWTSDPVYSKKIVAINHQLTRLQQNSRHYDNANSCWVLDPIDLTDIVVLEKIMFLKRELTARKGKDEGTLVANDSDIQIQ